MGKSRNPILRAGYRGIKAIGSLRRFMVSPRIRSQVLTRWRHKDRHFQGEAISREDRYPELFEACRKHLSDVPVPRILSFGCATGEEAFTLANYLPQAQIVGVDINPWCLKQCAQNNSNDRILFLHRMSPAFAAGESFDAIFCMAVFQRTEHRSNRATPADTGFTFRHFEDELQMLDAKLKTNGLLFLDECDFSFEETTVAERYKVLEFEGNCKRQDRPLFDKDNRQVADEHSLPRCFLKVG